MHRPAGIGIGTITPRWAGFPRLAVAPCHRAPNLQGHLVASSDTAGTTAIGQPAQDQLLCASTRRNPHPNWDCISRYLAAATRHHRALSSNCCASARSNLSYLTSLTRKEVSYCLSESLLPMIALRLSSQSATARHCIQRQLCCWSMPLPVLTVMDPSDRPCSCRSRHCQHYPSLSCLSTAILPLFLCSREGSMGTASRSVA